MFWFSVARPPEGALVIPWKIRPAVRGVSPFMVIPEVFFSKASAFGKNLPLGSGRGFSPGARPHAAWSAPTTNFIGRKSQGPVGVGGGPCP